MLFHTEILSCGEKITDCLLLLLLFRELYYCRLGRMLKYCNKLQSTNLTIIYRFTDYDEIPNCVPTRPLYLLVSRRVVTSKPALSVCRGSAAALRKNWRRFAAFLNHVIAGCNAASHWLSE